MIDWVEQAKSDWQSGRAYVDSRGTYKLRQEKAHRAGEMRWVGVGLKASWSDKAQAAFVDCFELHELANAQ